MQDPAIDAVLEALWGRALEHWDDRSVHTAVLEHAVRVQKLPDLAGRYRALSEDAERGPIAKERLDAIVAAATTLLWAMQTPKPTKVPTSITLSAFGVCAFLLLWLAWAMWGKR
ncbi:MAG: hypothetical protein ACRENE_22545 [Polyangiaceae bacterium]